MLLFPSSILFLLGRRSVLPGANPGFVGTTEQSENTITVRRSRRLLEKQGHPSEEEEDDLPLKDLFRTSQAKQRRNKGLDLDRNILLDKSVNPLNYPCKIVVKNPVLTLAPSGNRSNRMNNQQEHLAASAPVNQPGGPSRVQVEDSVQIQQPPPVPFEASPA